MFLKNEISRFYTLLRGNSLLRGSAQLKYHCEPRAQSAADSLLHHNMVLDQQTASGQHMTSTTQGGSGLCVPLARDQPHRSTSQEKDNMRQRHIKPDTVDEEKGSV